MILLAEHSGSDSYISSRT